MSKKKRRTSKANKVLRAAGTAGIVLGAATIDANVVFAAELAEEQKQQLEDIYSLQEEVLENGRQSTVEMVLPSTEETNTASEGETLAPVAEGTDEKLGGGRRPGQPERV